MTNDAQPIVCDLTVFDAATRREMAVKVPDLFRTAQRVEALPDGYAFHFANEPGTFMALATFVEHERQCCPFFHFTLEVAPGRGPLRLHMTGGEGVKTFMEATWHDLQDAIARGLVQTGPEDDVQATIGRAAPILAQAIGRVDEDQE